MICLLDLDGTLIDSAKRHWLLMEELLKKHYPKQAGGFGATAYMQYKADGHSGKQYLKEVLHLDEETSHKIQGYWQAKIEDEKYLETDLLYEDTIPFLQQIQKKGCRIAYLTARQNSRGLNNELARLGIAEYAEQVIVVNPTAAKEEKILATQTLQMFDPQVILIGDTENEQAVAEAVGIPVYLLHRGFRSRAYWETKNVTSYENLREIIEGINI